MVRTTDEDLMRRAAALGEALREGGEKLALAESCTGGWIAKVLTDIAGSSAWFDRGFVTYSNEAKEELLGVSAEALAEQGAVSEAVVRQMVTGTLARSAAGLALAVSGIAGPGGGSAAKPVGTVWFAWGRRGQEAQTQVERFAGDREAVRRAAVVFALERLQELVTRSP